MRPRGRSAGRGSSSAGRASASQAEGREFEARLPLQPTCGGSSAEERRAFTPTVAGSIPAPRVSGLGRRLDRDRFDPTVALRVMDGVANREEAGAGDPPDEAEEGKDSDRS